MSYGNQPLSGASSVNSLPARGPGFFTPTNCIRRESVRKQSPHIRHLKSRLFVPYDHVTFVALSSIQESEIMSIHQHVTNFAGKPVKDWEPDSGIEENTCYALRLSYDEAEEGRRWTDKFAAFLDDPSSTRVAGIVIGDWGTLRPESAEGSEIVVEALVAARDRLS